MSEAAIECKTDSVLAVNSVDNKEKEKDESRGNNFTSEIFKIEIRNLGYYSHGVS